MSKWRKDPEYLNKRRQKLQDKDERIEQVRNYTESGEAQCVYI